MGIARSTYYASEPSGDGVELVAAITAIRLINVRPKGSTPPPGECCTGSQMARRTTAAAPLRCYCPVIG